MRQADIPGEDLMQKPLEAGKISAAQLRGHFLGHWLSAAALHYQETEDVELKAKTEVILKELELCQKDNGGEWVCPIPEKYLYWIGKGRNIWGAAIQYS